MMSPVVYLFMMMGNQSIKVQADLHLYWQASPDERFSLPTSSYKSPFFFNVQTVLPRQ